MNELPKDRKLTEPGAFNSPRIDSSGPDAERPVVADSFGNQDDRDDTFGNRELGSREYAAYDQTGAGGNRALQPNALFLEDDLHTFRSHWDQVQASFVDEPRVAVEQADALVADVVHRITEQFASQREQLETQWARGENANTENLRQTFKRYRAFFDRLLSFKGEEMTAIDAPIAR